MMEKIIKVDRSFMLFMIIFWISYAIYFVIEIPDYWNNVEYSNTLILTFLIVPSVFLVTAGLLFPIISRIIITDEYVCRKGLFTKKIYYTEVIRVDIGPNFIKLYKKGGKKIVLSWIFQEYDSAKDDIFERLKPFKDIKKIYVSRYRK